MMIFEILVGRNTPSIGETFAEIFGPLRQMGYVPRPCPNMARKFGIFNFSPNVVNMVPNRKLLVSWSPECSYINKIEFGPKMTELCAENACPYMGTQTSFDYSIIRP